jgi:hypothetical protein
LNYCFSHRKKTTPKLYKNGMLARAELSFVFKKPNGVLYSQSHSLDTIEKLSPFPSLELL